MITVTLIELERFASTGVRPLTRSGSNSPEYEPDASSNRFADWPAIVAGCAFARACIDDAKSLPEPTWYALASFLSRCENGLAQFHEISAEDDRYDPAEVEAKFAQAKAASAPRTCRSISEDIGFVGCRRCSFWRHA